MIALFAVSLLMGRPALAFDYITSATSTVDDIFLNSTNNLQAGFKIISSGDSFDRLDVVFGRQASAGAIDASVSVYAATSTSFATADTYGPGNFIMQSATTSLSAIPASGSGTTTFAFASSVSLSPGIGYYFKYNVSARASSGQRYFTRSTTGPVQSSVIRGMLTLGGGYDDSVPAVKSYESSPAYDSTQITEVSPAGITVASTTVSFEVDYWYEDTDFATGTTAEVCVRATSVELYTYLDDSLSDFEICEDINASGGGQLATTTILGTGLFQGYASIVVNGAIYESRPFRFVVESTSLVEQWNPYDENATTTENVIVNGIRAVMQYLFVPDPNLISAFASLSLRDKFPFEYAYQMGDVYETLYTSDDGQELSIVVPTPIGDITFLNEGMIEAWEPIPSLINTTLAGIMWIMTALMLYRRILRVHDK